MDIERKTQRMTYSQKKALKEMNTESRWQLGGLLIFLIVIFIVLNGVIAYIAFLPNAMDDLMQPAILALVGSVEGIFLLSFIWLGGRISRHKFHDDRELLIIHGDVKQGFIRSPGPATVILGFCHCQGYHLSFPTNWQSQLYPSVSYTLAIYPQHNYYNFLERIFVRLKHHSYVVEVRSKDRSLDLCK